MSLAETHRHLRPNPKGVLRWLAVPDESPERLLFERLILAGKDTPLRMNDFAESLSMSVKDVAKTLFALNRAESVSVRELPPDRHEKGWASAGLAGLSEELASMTRPGQRILLSTDDGFQIARVGCGAYEGDVIAVRQQVESAAGRLDEGDGRADLHARLYVAGKGFHLSSSAALDRSHPAWIRLAFRLLNELAPLRGGERAC